MPLRTDAADPASTLLQDDAGTALARLHLRQDDGERVAARCVPLGDDLGPVVRHVRRDLGGCRLETAHEGLVAALVASGLALRRASTTLTHDLADLPEPAPLPVGWTWRRPGWDDDLSAARGCPCPRQPRHTAAAGREAST